ncbi:MAG: alpha-L-arabinofuranosidase, partial [Burkholderiales bacterium]|nr:alpha-L-arabinofuranosidase [Burkholderiales bacterium]
MLQQLAARLRRSVKTTAALVLLATGAASAHAAAQGPCDLYAAGGTPCVAAHSTARVLLSSYAGPLYQIRRQSDNTTRDVTALSSGIANAALQDAFCAGTT